MSTRAQQIELLAAGVLYDGAVIATPYAEFLAAGTSTPKNAWDDADKAVAITKKALDAQGRAVVYGDGTYDIKIYSGDPDAGGVFKFTVPGYKVTAVQGNARTITQDTTGSVDDALVRADTTDGNINYTLPSAALYPVSAVLTLKKTVAANTLTYTAASGQTIDGVASGSLVDANAAIQLISDGSVNWTGAQIVGAASTLGGYSADPAGAAGTIPVRNAAGMVPNHKGALVYNCGAHTNGQAITFTSEAYDTDSIHSTSVDTSRLTVPAEVTKVKLTAQVLTQASSTDAFVIRKNGSASYIGAPAPAHLDATNVAALLVAQSPVLAVVAGDYFEIYAGVSGTQADATGFSTWFAMEIIE